MLITSGSQRVVLQLATALQGNCKVKTIFLRQNYLPFSLLFFHDSTVDFSRFFIICDDIILLMTNRISVYYHVFLEFSNVVLENKYVCFLRLTQAYSLVLLLCFQLYFGNICFNLCNLFSSKNHLFEIPKLPWTNMKTTGKKYTSLYLFLHLYFSIDHWLKKRDWKISSWPPSASLTIRTVS